jgi:IclR family acetate operon transcriptional repressor
LPVNATKSGPRSDLLQSVQRASAVLTVLCDARRPLTAREISEAIGVNLTTCYHLLNTLEHEALLYRDPDRRFWLGHRIGQLREAFEEMLVPDPQLVAILRKLNDETGETSYLGVWSGADVVSVRVFEGRGGVRVRGLHLGYRQHVYARALGRALLAYRDDAFIDHYLTTTELVRLTQKTVTDPALLRQILADVRAHGAAVEREEFNDGVCCAAAPIFNNPGQAVAGFSVSVPKARFDSDAAAIVEAVKRCAQLASNALSDGHRSSTEVRP